MIDRGSRRRRVKVDKGLRFYHEILGLEHLQYGLWDGEPLDMDGLKAAQERYAQTLHSWIPEGVETILDVGCGTGASAATLLEKGYRVEGLSPDPYQRLTVERRTGIPFHLVRLQEHEPQKTYDLAMLSESSQYIWLEALFPSLRQIVPGGYVLIADYFITDDPGDLPEKSGHPLKDFEAAAESQGFTELRREDVTDRAMPTLDLAHAFIDRYAYPSLELARELFEHDYPRLFKLGRWLFGRRFAKDRAKVDYLIDSERFRKTKRYLFLLYRVPG